MEHMNLVKVIDPRLDLNHEKLKVILKGSLTNSWTRFFSQNANTSNVQITMNPPSPYIIMSRYIVKNFQLTTVINTAANTSGGPLLNDGYWGPRAYPLAAVSSSEQLTYNNCTTVQANLATYWNALLWFYSNDKAMGGNDSVGPFMLDQYQSYAEGAGSVRNPLALYGDNSYTETRRAYVGIQVIGNTPGSTSVTINWNFYEPVLISPAVFHKNANFSTGFVGLENMSYLCTFQDLNRVFSYIPNQGAVGINILPTEITTNLTSASILANYFTPDPIMPIPKRIPYNYFNVTLYPTNSGTAVPPGMPITITLQNIQLSSVPRRLYFFARRDDTRMTPDISDTYFGLNDATNPLTLKWDNNDYFTSASAMDLYNIAARCNCQMSYSQWLGKAGGLGSAGGAGGGAGSVLCLEAGIDFGLPSTQCSGYMGTFQMTATINFINTHPTDTITPTLYCVAVYDGEFTVDHGKCTLTSGQLTSAEVLNAPRTDKISYKGTEEIYGGDFFGKLKSFVNRIPSIHDKIKKVKFYLG